MINVSFSDTVEDKRLKFAVIATRSASDMTRIAMFHVKHKLGCSETYVLNMWRLIIGLRLALCKSGGDRERDVVSR